ncbi:hypothetical protein B0H66DRAFT_530024 [Apodospora peruviana]|uniref:Uncharacterized protein n=1 Tax=Apodospora peruviana TaxID=516989 RepID=A0AAE0IJD9_9PEZI|nr:hypothetical protein B0H66DRAFT_530024 [Apodospora peruviana]
MEKDYPPNAPPASRKVHHGREFIEYPDGSKWTRKVDPKNPDKPTGEWTAVEPALPINDTKPTPPPNSTMLSVLLEHQAEGEPKHWCLSAFRHESNDGTGTRVGQVWQVTGDAELMRFEHFVDVDRFASGCLAYSLLLNDNLTGAQLARVDEVARSELPPRAKSRAEVTENCQGWTIRVLRRLAAEGIVEESAVKELRGAMDPTG